MENKVGRFYSRKNGWDNGVPIKCFHSQIINKLPNVDIQGKNGLSILNYLTKTSLTNDYLDLVNLCKTYNNWYFYYGDLIDIYSQESTL